MSVTTHDENLEERLATLERRVEETAGRLQRHLQGRTAPSVIPPRQEPAVSAQPPLGRERAGTTGLYLGDLVGGRVLAWLGGAATLLGIVLFLVMAISRGWIDVEARMGLAGVASGALMAAGTWLHARRGRTEASVVLVGVATAGMFATLVVAGEVYRLISPLVALTAAMLVGALAATLAIRWAGQAIGALGMIGALISPFLLSVPSSGLTIAMLAVASACAVWTAVAQRWGWLAPAALAVCAPQWGSWILHDSPVLVDLAVLIWFGALGLAGAVAAQLGSSGSRLSPAATSWAVLGGAILALVGYGALPDAAGAGWLASWAAVHLAAGFWHRRWLTVPPALARVLEAVGLAVIAYLTAQLLGGAVLVAAWAAEGLAVCALARREGQRQQPAWFGGLSFLGLAVAHALILEAPPATLVRGAHS
ncbi:MAG: DUF2339 domain-containing protein, partial [Actinomycetota bacterium]|nr:DUF2339 domain-containing protein [Actinomycetota bacterium]